VTDGRVDPTGVEGPETSATQAVTRALAEAGVLDPDRPLYECVDAEALERLRAHAARAGGASVTVEFRYGDSHVTVEADDDMTVRVDARRVGQN
jgi:hypothetical protein